MGFDLFSTPGATLYDWLHPGEPGPPSPAGGTVYSAPIGPSPLPTAMPPALVLADPRTKLGTSNIFQTPGEVVYNLLHPMEPGSGQLTEGQVQSLASDVPSMVPGEGLINPEGTGALQRLGDSVTWLAGNVGWLLPVGVVLVLVGPELLRAVMGGRRR